jgi:alpha-tubulin suppressor-like RCC1 family protein
MGRAALAFVVCVTGCSLALDGFSGGAGDGADAAPEGSSSSDGGAGDAPGNEAAAPTSCVAEVKLGWSHSCARKNDGTVWCWGNNNAAQLAVAGIPSRPTPAPIAISGALAIAAGDSHGCAVLGDRTVVCWGYNNAGQLGGGSTSNPATTPVAVSGLTDVLEIAAGDDHSCARRGDETVWCWGDNAKGQLGDGGQMQRPSPVQVGSLAGAKAIAIGWTHSCALVAGGRVTCWGENTHGELGDGTKADRASAGVFVDLPAAAATIAAGFHHSCAALSNGEVWCWGQNAHGELGDATTADRAVPVRAGTIADARELSTNGYATIGPISHTCARTANGASCWGANTFGEIGDGTTADRGAPTAVSMLGPIVTLGVGAKHTCAVLPGSAPVWCWGANDVGQLGTGAAGESHVPVPSLLTCP